MKVIVFLLVLCFALGSSAEISSWSGNGVPPSSLEGNSPVFMINFGDETSFYEAVSMMSSTNYVYLEFNKMEYGNMYGSTCFKTDNWKNVNVREMNLLSGDNNSSSDIALIFSHNLNSRDPKPYPVPWPVPLPFHQYQSQSQEDSHFYNSSYAYDQTPKTYQMKSQELDNDRRIISEETTTVKFFTPAKEASSVDLFNLGFTDYVPCSEL